MIAACVVVALVIEAKGTGYAYYGQYVYDQRTPSNGHAKAWSRFRKSRTS